MGLRGVSYFLVTTVVLFMDLWMGVKGGIPFCGALYQLPVRTTL